MRLWISLVLSTLPVSQALAWGDDGHRIVCQIALLEMAPATLAEVDALIATDPPFASFADACSWADHPRKRDDEHYVNLPRDAPGLTAEPCPLADRCVVTSIGKDMAVLASPTAGEVPRLMALKYLGHFVGDLHQPLHVSFQDDRGETGSMSPAYAAAIFIQPGTRACCKKRSAATCSRLPLRSRRRSRKATALRGSSADRWSGPANPSLWPPRPQPRTACVRVAAATTLQATSSGTKASPSGWL